MKRKHVGLPLGLIGALVLIMVVERQLSVREPLQFSTAWAADWRQSATMARAEAARSEILCFGDSLAKFGVVPAILQRQTGLKAYNFALNVGHPGSSFYLLKRALAAGAHPKVILFDIKSHLLSSRPQDATRQWPELIGRSDAVDLVRETLDPAFAASLAVCTLLTSVRTRFEIREAAFAAIKGEWSSYAYLAPAIRRNWKQNQGAQLMPAATATHDDSLWARSLYPDHWKIEPIQDRYVRRFLDAAFQTEARVILIIPPPLPNVQKRREAMGADEAYEKYLQLLQHDYPHLEVVDGRHANYGDDLHSDSIHLNIDGAREFSLALGNFLAAQTTGPNPWNSWVKIPAPNVDHPASTVALEDINASRRAVQQGQGVRR